MLKRACTSPNLANRCLHSSTGAKFYPITGKYKVLLSNIRGNLSGGQSLVVTRKFIVVETHIRKSTNACKSIAVLDASNHYPLSIFQPIPTRFYPRNDFDEDFHKLKKLALTKSQSFNYMVNPCFQQLKPDCRMRASTPQELRKRLIVSLQMGFVDIAAQCLKQWVVSIITLRFKRHDLL